MVKTLASVARVCVLSCLVSCTSSPPVSKHTRDQQLITRAEQEVSRRGFPLRPTHTAMVRETEAILEIPPYSQYYYTVEFSRPTPKRAVPLYTVSFDRATGRLHDFYDRRDEVTPDEIAAAKRAMIRRVGGTPKQFSTGSAVSGDTVEFTILDLRDGQRRSGHCFVHRKTLKVFRFELLPRQTI